MIICNLASGSTGNCTFVEINKHKILIDAGKNKKYIQSSLAKIGISLSEIEYIFLTHSHDDHTSALKTLLKECNLKLVLTSGMLEELSLKEYVDKMLIYNDNPVIDGIDIESYKMSHDVKDVRSFILNENNKRFALITDTGYFNLKYLKYFNNLDVYYMESNHDIEMLLHGPYPDWLQKRVLSDEGHLSNKYAGIYLSKMIGNNTKHIGLLHLSEKNNNEEICMSTVIEELVDNDISNIKIYCTKPNEISEVIEL